MWEAIKDTIKKAKEFEYNTDHLYMIIPRLLDNLRDSINLAKISDLTDFYAIFSENNTDDEIQKFKFYRILVIDHIRKYFLYRKISIVLHIYYFYEVKKIQKRL